MESQEYFHLTFLTAITAINEIQQYLDKLLCFTAAERSFVEEFRDKKYFPEKLFESNGIVLRLAWHPTAFWKCDKKDG